MTFPETFAFMQAAFNREMNPHDFEEWFNERVTAQAVRSAAEEKTLTLSADGAFAELFEMCSRKRSQLTLPIQTFLPLKPI